MKNREKILLYSLLGILLLWRGAPWAWGLFADPLDQRRTRIAALEDEVHKLKLAERQLNAAKSQLKRAALRSLPPNTVHASREYHIWLTNLGNELKLSDYKVSPMTGGTQAGKTYSTVRAEVTFEATLSRLCDFLYAFRKSGLFQRVVTLTIDTARHEGDPPLKVKLLVEGVAMASSPDRAKLFADPAGPPPLDVPLPERSEYSSITAKNLFVKTYNGPPRPPDGGRPRPPTGTDNFPEATEFVFLTGRLDSNVDGARVFLYDQLANKQADLGVGDEFAMAGVNGKVLSIGDDHAVIEIKGEAFRLRVGKNFKQMEKLPRTELPATGGDRPSSDG